MELNFYINYNGNCKEAFKFYEKHLGGKIILMMPFNQMPDNTNVPPNWENAILHARIEIGSTVLMGADIPGAEPMRSAYVTLKTKSSEQAENIYKLLSEEGEIFMKMEETFFAKRFAQLRDKFGTSWMLLYEE